MSAPRPAYRADIDGLRAVAVLAVVAFHAVPVALRGGYVGVDVFFAISGFLITRLLLADATRRAPSLREFWARRVRRIFPALIVLLAAALAAGWFLLLDSEFRALCRHATGSALFVQNVVLRREAGYFDAATELKPLLHVWSLAVEEQFYVLWPLLLVIAGRRGRPTLWRVTVGLFSVSVALSFVQAYRSPVPAFFLLPSRGWELLAGSLLAQWLPPDASPTATAPRCGGGREALALAGLTAIVVSLATIDRATPFPGPWALLPVGGTLALIAAGPSAWINRAVLARRELVFVGLVSYPLYLWHWPMLSFLHVLGQATPARIAVAVATSFVLAAATFFLVERPIRRSRAPAATIALLAAMGCIALAGVAGIAGAWSSRLAGSPANRFDVAAHDWVYPGAAFSPVDVDGLRVWRGGIGPRTVLVYGDSNAQQYAPRVQRLLEEGRLPGTAVVFASTGSCPPFPGVEVTIRPNCPSFADRVDALARTPQIETIVVAGQWLGYRAPRSPTRGDDREDRLGWVGDTPATKAIEALAARIRAWRAAGKRVVVVLNIPWGAEAAPLAQLQRDWRGGIAIRTRTIDRERWNASRGDYLGRLEAEVKAAGAEVVDPTDTLCTTTQCPVVSPDGEPIYRDIAHLRASFVRENVRYLDPVLLPSPAMR